MRAADMGIPRARVVAVVAALPDGQEQVGSGYLVSGRLVLTAAHCTRNKTTGAAPLGLRIIRASDGATAEVADLAADVVAASVLDVAVVRLTDTPWEPDLPAPMFARVDRSRSGMLIDCAAIGYPLFQRDPNRRARHTAELHGTIYQTDEAEAGRLLLREPLLTSVGQEELASQVEAKDGSSTWGGLSGALVFHVGRALGVVAERHPQQGRAAVQLVAFDTLRDRAETDEVTRQVADAIGLPPVDRMPWAAVVPLLSGRTDVVLPAGPRRDRRVWDTHWEPRSRGVERVLTNTGWYFTGRRRVREELHAWLIEEPGPRGKGRIVTSGPGSGKSAVLARIVTLSDRDFRSSVPDVDPALDPPVEVVDVAVHARGKSLAEVVGDIERTVDLTEHRDAEWLVTRLLRSGTPLTVVVDALDEAAEPEPIARQLLRPLAHDGAAQGLRILVGARRPLLAVLGRTDFDVIDLDEPRYLGLEDLQAYVRARLLLAGESTPTPYQDDPELAERVAHAVAQRAHPNFLVAQLVSRALVQSDLPVDTIAVDWLDRFPSEVDEAMETYLSGLGPDRQRVRDLLRPLAYARGDGLAPGPLWAELASLLADGRQYQPADVAWLRESAAAFLVETTSTTPGVEGPSCRIFHEALAEHLRDPSDETRNQRQIAEALESSVPAVDGHPDWKRASPYVTNHLAYHAALGGRLDALVSQPGFLVAADPDRLLPVLSRVNTSEGRRAAALYRRSTDQLDTTNPAIRASYLELTARCRGSDELADEFARARTDRPWRTCWSRWQPTSDHRVVITGHNGWIHGITAELLRDGTPVVATASSDSTVRVWDLDTGRPHGRPFSESHTFANDVTIGACSDGTPVIVAACGGLRGPGTVHRWNLESGEPLGPALQGHDAAVRAVRVGQLSDGTRLVISASEGDGSAPGTVRVWTLESGEPIGEPFDDHRSPITAMTIHTSAAGTTVVSADSAAMLHVWDPETRDTYTRDLTLYDADIAQIRAVSTAELHGSPVVVVSCFFRTCLGTSGPLLWAWNLASGEPVSEPIRPDGFNNPVLGLTAAALPDGRVAVVAGVDATVRAWDLGTGEALVSPLRGHTNSVTQVAATKRRDGRLVAVSGGSADRTVRIWELDPESHPDQGDPAPPIRAMAAGAGPNGRPVVAISQGSHIEVDDVASGIPLTSLSRKQSGRVIGMGLLLGRDLKLLVVAVVASGYNDEFSSHGTVWIANLDLPSNPQGGLLARWLQRRRVVTRPPRLLRIERPSAAAFTLLPLGEPAVVYGTRHNNIDRGGHYFAQIDDLAIRRTWGAAIGGTDGQMNAIAVGRARDGTLVVAAGGGYTYAGTDSAESDYAVRVWDARTGELLVPELTGHTAQINAVAIGDLSSLPAVVVTGSGSESSTSSQDDCSVRIWDLETGHPYRQPLMGHTSPVTAVAVAEMADGMPVVASGSAGAGTMRVWNLLDGTPRIRPLVLGAPVRALEVVDNKYVVLTSCGVVVLEDHPLSATVQYG